MRFAVVGAGVVGTALATRLHEKGHYCIGVSTRSERSYLRFNSYTEGHRKNLRELTQQAQIIFVTTQDQEIRNAAEGLAANWDGETGQVWIHCAGAFSSRILEVDAKLPVRYLSLHPLQSFAAVDTALQLLSQTHFGIEGDCVEIGERIVNELGGIPHSIETEKKALYHAAAVMGSNFLVTLADLACSFMREAGMKKDEALEALLPLMKGSLSTIESLRLPQALTGPIARGDVKTVSEHIAIMSPIQKEIYQLLSRETLRLAENKWSAEGEEYPEQTKKAFLELIQ